jgi:bacterial/archaeal transporter family protein
MDRWMVFATISMLFAGATSVVAKRGLEGISAEVGLFVRTLFVTAFVLAFAAAAIPRGQLAKVAADNLIWLGISGATTAVSWVFYYKALKDGNVSTVALIDKGSFVVAVILAWLFLGERLTLRIVIGGCFILTGLLIVARK